jgi:hypothetical protein
MLSSDEPFSNLVEAAVGMHEIFVTYVQSGFTENQALKLIAYILTGPRIDPDERDPGGP